MSVRGQLLTALFACSLTPALLAQSLHITIPQRSELTPVQKLNREGVEAVIKRKYEKAERLFYKAYLFDPADPFTLNNLGYVSEVQGQIDRAEKFYQLATLQDCNATIDRSTAKELKGKPMMDALGSLKNIPMRVNRINVLGTQLLSKDRNFEAEAVFKQALELDQHNAFTLNNLGVAEEATGDWEDALRFYDEAASSQSKAPVVISAKQGSRGKPVSVMAAHSAQELRKRMATMNAGQVRAQMLTVRGVYAINQNKWDEARKDFVEAASLDPRNAFTLNNLGYVAERDGDLETAKEYYARALRADDSGARIGLATDASASGRQLSTVADTSQRSVGDQLDAFSERRRGQKAPTELKRRQPLPAATPSAPALAPSTSAAGSAAAVQPQANF